MPLLPIPVSPSRNYVDGSESRGAPESRVPLHQLPSPASPSPRHDSSCREDINSACLAAFFWGVFLLVTYAISRPIDRDFPSVTHRRKYPSRGSLLAQLACQHPTPCNALHRQLATPPPIGVLPRFVCCLPNLLSGLQLRNSWSPLQAAVVPYITPEFPSRHHIPPLPDAFEASGAYLSTSFRS